MAGRNGLSKVFLQELAKANKALDALDDPVGSGDLVGTADIKSETTDSGVPTKASMSYDLPEGTSPSARKSASKTVSREMAKQLMTEFGKSYSATKGKTLDSLVGALTGATKVGRRRSSRTNISYALGGSDEDFSENLTSMVETLGGKRRRTTTLRPIMEELMRDYVVKDMTRPNAPLKFRSGRFANSTEITRMGVSGKGKKQTLSLFYTYMLSPYSVFDPSNSHPLSSAGRNPQRIIGQALQNAARDMVSKRYNISIRQE